MKTKEELLKFAKKSDMAIKRQKKDEIKKQEKEKEARKELVKKLVEGYANEVVSKLEKNIKKDGSKAYGHICVYHDDISVALKEKLIELGFNVKESYSPQGTRYHDGYGYDEEVWGFTITLK